MVVAIRRTVNRRTKIVVPRGTRGLDIAASCFGEGLRVVSECLSSVIFEFSVWKNCRAIGQPIPMTRSATTGELDQPRRTATADTPQVAIALAPWSPRPGCASAGRVCWLLASGTAGFSAWLASPGPRRHAVDCDQQSWASGRARRGISNRPYHVPCGTCADTDAGTAASSIASAGTLD